MTLTETRFEAPPTYKCLIMGPVVQHTAVAVMHVLLHDSPVSVDIPPTKNLDFKPYPMELEGDYALHYVCVNVCKVALCVIHGARSVANNIGSSTTESVW